MARQRGKFSKAAFGTPVPLEEDAFAGRPDGAMGYREEQAFDTVPELPKAQPSDATPQDSQQDTRELVSDPTPEGVQHELTANGLHRMDVCRGCLSRAAYLRQNPSAEARKNHTELVKRIEAGGRIHFFKSYDPTNPADVEVLHVLKHSHNRAICPRCLAGEPYRTTFLER